jgi:hypothetical protein
MQNTSMSYGAGAAARASSIAPWGQRRGWRYGSPEFAVKSLGVFLAVALFPLASFVFNGFQAPAWPRDYPLFGVLWALFMALAFPLWTWAEARAFERWTATLEAGQRDAAHARQAVRVANARMFWFGALAAYVVVAVLALAAR